MGTDPNLGASGCVSPNEGAIMTRSVRTILTIATIAASVSAVADAGLAKDVDVWGRTADDRETERFLAEAEVVAVEDIGSGITQPQRLTLRAGDTTRRAIFKDVDVYSNEIAYTNQFETSFQDSFEFEVAAYRLDRLLGIRLVPVTVLREVNGKRGSVQLWIERATNLEDLVNSGAECHNLDLLLERLMLMYVLDAVIYNVDRNLCNVLVRGNDDLFYLIDHSRSFRTTKKLPKLQEQRPIPISRTVAARLQQLDETNLDERLGDLLTKRQRRAILARRDLLVEQLGSKGLLSSPHRVMAQAGSVAGR
jgi:hypothetical protein